MNRIEKIIHLNLVFHRQALNGSINGAMFRFESEEADSYFFSEFAINDRFMQTHEQNGFFNPLNDFNISEHNLALARNACREFRTRKLLPDLRHTHIPSFQ